MSDAKDDFDPDYDPLKDPRSTEELIATALIEMDMEEDEDEYEYHQKNALRVLRSRCNREMFETAKLLGQDTDPKKRCLCADILGDMGEFINAKPESDNILERHGDYIHPFEEESVDVLLAMLETEENTDVLCSIGIAFGHLKNPRPIEALLKLKNHPHEDVRDGVVHGLLGQEDERAIQAMIELSQDEDTDVRDWATFGLGTSIAEVDTPEIRAALYRNIDDPDEETRYEAIIGLVLRRDRDIVARVLDELTSGRVDIDSVWGWDFVEMLYSMRHEINDPRIPPIIEEGLKVVPWLTDQVDEDDQAP